MSAKYQTLKKNSISANDAQHSLEPATYHSSMNADSKSSSLIDNNINNNSLNDLIRLDTPRKPASKSYTILTPKRAALILQDKFQAGSIKGSIFTLIICIVGAGSLALPWAFRVAGLILGVIMLLFASFCTFISLHFLVFSSLYIKGRPSFVNLAYAAGGKCLQRYTSINLMINLFGTITSYLVACGGIIDLVQSVIFKGESYYKYITIGVAGVIVFPLSLMRSMGALRFGNLFGM